jgi:hypothetical protein
MNNKILSSERRLKLNLFWQVERLNKDTINRSGGLDLLVRARLVVVMLVFGLHVEDAGGRDAHECHACCVEKSKQKIKREVVR